MGINTTHIKKFKEDTFLDSLKSKKRNLSVPHTHRFYCGSCWGFHYIKFHDPAWKHQPEM